MDAKAALEAIADYIETRQSVAESVALGIDSEEETLASIVERFANAMTK